MPERCEGCPDPILPGQARYTGGEGADPPKYWHWECHERFLADCRKALHDIPGLAERAQQIIRRLQHGKRD
jgi:hypothetical protein